MPEPEVEPGSFTDRLVSLDMHLTGKDRQTCLHARRNSGIRQPADFLFGPADRAYYLSDGGYSRLVWRGELEGYLDLTSHSRDEVKAKFAEHRARPLVAAVEAHVHVAVGDHGRYAGLAWQAGDVLTLRPGWTEARAEAWLAENEKYIADRLCELGWDVISALLPPQTRDDRGLDPKPDDAGDDPPDVCSVCQTATGLACHNCVKTVPVCANCPCPQCGSR